MYYVYKKQLHSLAQIVSSQLKRRPAKLALLSNLNPQMGRSFFFLFQQYMYRKLSVAYIAAS
jgi:hypothetical protein